MSDTANEAPRPLVSVSGTDTDAAVADLAGMYAGRAWHSGRTDEEYWYRYVALGDERMSVRRSQMHGSLRGDVAVEGEVVVQWIDAGSAAFDVGRDEVRMQAGVPTLFPIEQRFDMEYRDWDQRLVHVDRDLVLDVASEQYLVDGTLAFDRFTPPTPESIARWRQAVASSVRTLRTDGIQSLAWNEAQRDVTRALLDMYRFRAEPAPSGWGEHRLARVRAAVEYIHAHAHEPLTVSDIARAADLSVRGLQEAFQRALDRTPMQYLREVRLRRSHDDLQRSAPGQTSVAEVAARWGFTHMGRFSGEYLHRFGEYPKQTLRR
ncbi:helix-turn-helix transcriptional regulator [Curtobacterium sp. MCPF17_002]|uniref:helix-turn-helix transcriptional regulator n=1 Tax=Curtobacterium sp. MCPF17_002 TaxID=2175645 RepID=UPI000DA93F2A|nr:helix-turn-helix transcriptional regulator [Curtobacterium sp. MCPF17_002]WIB77922.1 helix-turn-helix transcriptional regulator [Curtobacterium sp. MCPF17_002]